MIRGLLWEIPILIFASLLLWGPRRLNARVRGFRVLGFWALGLTFGVLGFYFIFIFFFGGGGFTVSGF